MSYFVSSSLRIVNSLSHKHYHSFFNLMQDLAYGEINQSGGMRVIFKSMSFD